MWKDIGLEKWLFDFDKEEDKKNFPAAVLEMLSDTDGTQKLVKDANHILEKYFQAFACFMRSV